VIHDRLPFLDLPDGAFLPHSVDTTVVHRARRGQQVRRVIARVVERLDLRFERLAILVLGYKSEFALGVFGIATTIWATIRGQVRLYNRSFFPVMSIAR